MSLICTRQHRMARYKRTHRWMSDGWGDALEQHAERLATMLLPVYSAEFLNRSLTNHALSGDRLRIRSSSLPTESMLTIGFPFVKVRLASLGSSARYQKQCGLLTTPVTKTS